ncbi:hypothetical protein A9Q99_26440 [Gammaproteobacteria bacterium 45_16_T64]|nr:hypothetical protein A9Q99_26440 [Gammaproteobacteria bacterium 45_16_T64]
MTDLSTHDAPVCPVGEPVCSVVDRVVELQNEVETLSELIRTDNLTGLYNQRYLIETLELEMERTRRTGRFTAIVMFDLDHFKQVNDTWGHESGNAVLKKTAEVVGKAIRKLDVACRYGGEEFVIVLPNTGLIEAAFVAERIRYKLEASTILVEGGEINVTASFGVDIFTEHQKATAEELISRADGYLYDAKENGRNQVNHVPAEKISHEAQISIDERDAIFDMFGDQE